MQRGVSTDKSQFSGVGGAGLYLYTYIYNFNEKKNDSVLKGGSWSCFQAAPHGLVKKAEWEQKNRCFPQTFLTSVAESLVSFCFPFNVGERRISSSSVLIPCG